MKRMKSHKRFLVWAEIDRLLKRWILVGESDDWSRATNLVISCFDRKDVTDVMINEFIPIQFTDSREITFNIQSIDRLEVDQFPTGIFLEKNTGLFFVNGRSKTLSLLESKLLSMMYQRENKIVSKSDIALELWNEEYIPGSKSDGRIETIVHRLRKKLETDPKNPKFILNIKERGYIFIKDGEY